MLKMLQGELATASGLTPKAMNSIENGASTARTATLERIQSVLEQHGIAFFDSDEGRGVMLKGDIPEHD